MDTSFKGNFIQGKFVKPSGSLQTIVSEDPGDLDHPVGEIACSASAVGDAVTSARGAAAAWAALDAKTREAYLVAFQKLVCAAQKEFAILLTRETGKILSESEAEIARISGKVDSALRYEAALLEPVSHEIESGVRGTLRYRPRGVLAILSPFNVPAYLAAGPVVSALATGNTVVLKPSELTPFVSQFLAELFEKAKLPPGVFNLVQGGGDVGQALVEHPDIDGVIFTGSWQTGNKIQSLLQRQPQKICALEMGGKNAAIVLADAGLEEAAREIASGAFMTSGQRCNATSRVILEQSIVDRFVPLFLKEVDRLKTGYGLDTGIHLGPLASKKGFDKARELIGQATQEGFEALRESEALNLTKKGYYLKPSVHLKKGTVSGPVRQKSYMDDEVFGPDVALYVAANLDEAIALNNRSSYGLSASIFTQSRECFEKLLTSAQDGIVNWNVSTARSSARLPFGGLKQSGNHRPAGFFSPYLCTVPVASVEKAP